jgi:hypothetical protein
MAFFLCGLRNGGAVFLFLYFGCVLFIGLPVVIAELSIGRRAQGDAFAAFEHAGNSSLWTTAETGSGAFFAKFIADRGEPIGWQAAMLLGTMAALGRRSSRPASAWQYLSRTVATCRAYFPCLTRPLQLPSVTPCLPSLLGLRFFRVCSYLVLRLWLLRSLVPFTIVPILLQSASTL